ncbi:MAG: hypothetical protein IT344_05645 [Candidatus Dadabacteria bacterium]|nr:hypothetical protein [Candidatus Dadabacteria bacterium]
MKNREDFLYDVRIVNRNIRDGAVSKKDYGKYLDGLPDVEANSEPLIIEDEPETLSTVSAAADTEEAAGEAEEEEE